MVTNYNRNTVVKFIYKKNIFIAIYIHCFSDKPSTLLKTNFFASSTYNFVSVCHIHGS